MFEFFRFPHVVSLFWSPGLFWLRAISSSLIALAFFLMPAVLAQIVRRRKDIYFGSIFPWFSTFLVACGIARLMDVVTLWYPVYWVSGWLNAVTAAISAIALVVLIRISVVSLATPNELGDQRFQVLIEDAPDAILQVDAAGTIVIANRTAETMFGDTREELLGTNVDLLIPSDRRSEHSIYRDDFAHAATARAMGKGIDDLRARRKDGSEVSVEIGLSPVETTAGIHVTAVIRDVTDRKHAEQQLQHALAQLNSLMESTTVCVMAMDSDWKVNYVNGNAKALLQVQGEMLGMTLWEAFPVDQPAIRELLLKVMETRQPASYEKYYKPLDLSVTVQAHPWDEGGVAIFFSDVSEQKRMQHELDWERVMREQRLEVLARFSAGIAHEMKNPLAIIHARASDLAEMAEDSEISPGDVTKTCASIVKTSERALRILRGLAALAREGSNDPMLKAEVGEMVKQAIELVQARYREQGILLEAIVPDGLPAVECRETQIGQVLMNLLNNAFDAVDASPDSERWVRVEASSEGEPGDALERVLIDVIDGGPELSAEVKEHLMETFYTTKPLGGGIGIGLSVSRAIADDHNGSLQLRECSGHTCFRLSLPVRVAKPTGVAA